MNNYDDWKLDTPDNHVKQIYTCEQCVGAINLGDSFISTKDHYVVHDDCFDDFAWKHLGAKYKVAGDE
ncbi:hypothetical protein [Peribacillus frigoritolerans]|uniref:Uncharacterized protein n=1 Tax=Peribacillus castrilensis TaxID=2897690 RepID=A0AAW9NPB0_9BACI|nr:hypothetical protein [Peribacillus castrilensis]